MDKQYDKNDARNLVDPLEDSKDALLTYAMYYYESLRQAGHSTEQAKERTAEVILETYENYCEAGNLEKKSVSSGTVEKRLTKLVEDIKALGKKYPETRNLYNDVIALQKQLTK